MAEMMHALTSGDQEFDEQLQKAKESGDQRPEARITACQAGVEAFSILFDPEQIETDKANWPTKKEVIQLATSILENGGQPATSKRHWSRVLDKIGSERLARNFTRRPTSETGDIVSFRGHLFLAHLHGR